jgi:hypothetical protein
MSFTCGCHVIPGEDVTPEMLKAHLVHTMEAMLFWELLIQRNGRSHRLGKLRLSQARQRYIEAVTELYPESTIDPEKDLATVC